MRWIGKLDSEQQGQTFSSFLNQKNISHHIEVEKKTEWENSDYGLIQCQIWIDEENQVKEATDWLNLFKSHPEEALFHQTLLHSAGTLQDLSSFHSIESKLDSSPASSKTTAWQTQPLGFVTRLILAICCTLFILTQLTSTKAKIPAPFAGWESFTSPVEQALLYDFPHFYELMQDLLTSYSKTSPLSLEKFETNNQPLIQELKKTPFWSGIYSLWFVKKEGVKQIIEATPLFEKIRQGEVWRLFTPALMHQDIFHIFFNMLWLLVLGKQIEQRLHFWPYIFFIITVGIFSNTAQYLMIGPNFIGFSGVLCGMMAFIWTRQVQAPWEGYQIDRLTLIFMLIFILGMAAIQLLAFFAERFFSLSFSLNIANTAHVIGGLVGFLLGRLNYFSWRRA